MYFLNRNVNMYPAMYVSEQQYIVNMNGFCRNRSFPESFIDLFGFQLALGQVISPDIEQRSVVFCEFVQPLTQLRVMWFDMFHKWSKVWIISVLFCVQITLIQVFCLYLFLFSIDQMLWYLNSLLLSVGKL